MTVHKKTMIYITLIFAFVLAVISISLPVKEESAKKYLDTLDLKGIDRLMIVAHPDDESLWAATPCEGPVSGCVPYQCKYIPSHKI